MDAIKETQGIYKPIRVLFSTPVYERALQTCWHLQSYKTNIAVVLEFLRLQQEHLLSSDITTEDMTNLLLEKGKKSLRVQLWEFEIEDRDEDVAKPLLNLTWDVLNSLKMRDVVFEARRFLASPWEVPASFRNPKLLALVREYAETLSQLNRDSPRLLQPKEVVMEVVPKIFHGLWLPPPESFQLSMPSKDLSAPAIGLTQSVLDRVSKALPSLLQQVQFTRSICDQVVQSVLEEITEKFPENKLEKRLSSFSLDLLKSITSTAAEEICKLFRPQTEPDTTPETTSILGSPLLPDADELTEDLTGEPVEDHTDEPVGNITEESVDHLNEGPAEDRVEETVADLTKEPAQDDTIDLSEDLNKDLPADTLVPDTEGPAPSPEAQPCVELSVLSTDVGVQTSSLPSPTTEGCVFCRLSRWIRKIYYNYLLCGGNTPEE